MSTSDDTQSRANLGTTDIATSRLPPTTTLIAASALHDREQPVTAHRDVVGVEPTPDGGFRIWLASDGERILLFALIIVFPLTALTWRIAGTTTILGAVVWLGTIVGLCSIYLRVRRRRRR